MNLGMTVMTGGYTIRCARRQNLIHFDFAKRSALIGHSGLQKTAAPAAAIVIGAVGRHVDKIFLAHHGLDNVAHILGNRVAQGFAHQLARILAGEFDLAVFIPFGADFQLTFPDPLGV